MSDQLQTALTQAVMSATIDAEASANEHGVDIDALNTDATFARRKFMRRQIVTSLPNLPDEYRVWIRWTSTFWSRVADLTEHTS